ncbi:MAG: FAD-dependent oxidoreductase [Sneathiella sp.]
MTKIAIIAGGSIAGLATAKALSDKFDRVLVFEPDKIETGVFARKGTPQANHVHGLLKGGGNALTRLFPDLPERLNAAGAASCNFCREVRWYINEDWMPRFDGDLTIYFQTRPLLEGCLREAVEALANVEIVYQCRVENFLLDDARKKVVAAVVRHDSGQEETISADFFIDAMGRGSFFPRWLKREGFGEVPEDHIKVDLGYASCLMELPDVPRDWKSILIYPTGPAEVRGSTLVQVEHGKWLLTLAGYHNNHPPADIDGFLAFAKSLPRTDIYEAVKEAKIVGDIRLHKFPHGQWRHYDELFSFPLAVLPVGDTNASLNPLFGQGMSVAALSVVALARSLEAADLSNPESLVHLKDTYFKELRKIFATPWDLALGQDFRYPETIGKRPLGLKLKNTLKSLIMSSSSIEIIERFYQIVHLVKEEKSLYHPRWICKYVAAAIKK